MSHPDQAGYFRGLVHSNPVDPRPLEPTDEDLEDSELEIEDCAGSHELDALAF